LRLLQPPRISLSARAWVLHTRSIRSATGLPGVHSTKATSSGVADAFRIADSVETTSTVRPILHGPFAAAGTRSESPGVGFLDGPGRRSATTKLQKLDALAADVRGNPRERDVAAAKAAVIRAKAEHG
jgi:hypothetical protein